MKSKRKYDSTSKKLKAAGIQAGVPRRQGEWEKIRDQRPAGKPKPDKVERRKGSTALIPMSDKALLGMAQEKASGKADKQLAAKYGVSVSYVQDALRTLYLNNKTGREILKGVLLENAVACAMGVREEIGDLQPMQKVIATGVMTQRYIDLDKHTASVPAEVDYQALERIGAVLGRLNKIASDVDDEENRVIDINVETEDADDR